MVDGRYYGRCDKTNRILSNAEVVRLLDRRLADRRDLRAEARTIRTDLVGDDQRLFVAVADPVGAREAQSERWYRFGQCTLRLRIPQAPFCVPAG